MMSNDDRGSESALQLLEGRVSIAALQPPGPSPEVMERAFKAALRAPDHGYLRPWRFLLIEGEGLDRLGDLFVEAALQDDPGLNVEKQEKLRGKPHRAPTIVVGIARLQEHPKVPNNEQRISAGTAIMNLMLSLRAQGFGSIWRTGEVAYHPAVVQGLGLSAAEEIVAFVYVGTPAGKIKDIPQLQVGDFVQAWPGVQ